MCLSKAANNIKSEEKKLVEAKSSNPSIKMEANWLCRFDIPPSSIGVGPALAKSLEEIGIKANLMHTHDYDVFLFNIYQKASFSLHDVLTKFNENTAKKLKVTGPPSIATNEKASTLPGVGLKSGTVTKKISARFGQTAETSRNAGDVTFQTSVQGTLINDPNEISTRGRPRDSTASHPVLRIMPAPHGKSVSRVDLMTNLIGQTEGGHALRQDVTSKITSRKVFESTFLSGIQLAIFNDRFITDLSRTRPHPARLPKVLKR